MASAHSAEEARAAIMSRGKLAYTKNFSSYFDEEDEDDIEALARFLSQLEQDISVDVNPVETVFIAGSE